MDIKTEDVKYLRVTVVMENDDIELIRNIKQYEDIKTIMEIVMQ